MKDRPMLYSGPMVRALLDERKTQTRRLVKPQPEYAPKSGFWLWKGEPISDFSRIPCPYGQPGDRLIVKEHVWMWCEKVPNGTTKKGRAKFKYVPMRYAQIFYCSDHPEKPTIKVFSEYRGYEWAWRKKLGRYIPRWASRITLEITSVRVERLQDISDADAKAEGCSISQRIESLGRQDWPEFPADYRESFSCLWESINGPGSWAANPWVWVIEFRRVK